MIKSGYDNGQSVFPAYISPVDMQKLIIVSGINVKSMAYNSGTVLNLTGNTGTAEIYFALNKSVVNGNYIMHSFASHLSNGTDGLGASNSFGSMYFSNSSTANVNEFTNSFAIDIEMGYAGSYLTDMNHNSTGVHNGPHLGTANTNWAHGHIYYNESSSNFNGQINTTSETFSNPENSSPSSYAYLSYGLQYTNSADVEQTLLGYEFLTSNIPMPTTSIGSGSPNVANSSTLNRIFYQSTSNYAPNPLDQIYTYTVYDSFSDNYITLYSNSSWTYLSSSGYSHYNPITHALTFSGISGIGTVQATYLQPSQQIGQAAFATLTATNNGQPVQLFNGFTIDASYTPFDSNTVKYINGTSPQLQMPFGAVANFSVIDAWGQEVGSISGVLIDQTTLSIDLPVSLTYVSFQFVNTTASQVFVSADGVTQSESGYISFYVANQSQYSYYARIYDSASGTNVNFTGNFSTDAPAKTVYINASAPLAEIQLEANAYAGSQVGQLSSSGSDKVITTINGNIVDLGSTYAGLMGERLNVRISTVLDQTLYNGTILLNAPYQSDTINVKTPSWNFQLRNAEQVYNKTSPLATEIINMTYVGSSGNVSYHTSDMVGNVLSVYLASGNYHIHLHDKAVFSTNFTLFNNTYYIIFGQQLLTVSAYDKIYSNTAGLHVLPVNAPSELSVGKSTQLQWQIYFANGTALTGSALQQFVSNSTITVSNGTSPTVLTPEISNGIIYANFTASVAGSFTVRIVGGFNDSGTVVGGKYSYPLVIFSTLSDSGLHLAISGPSTISTNQTYVYYLQFHYSNGSLLSSQYSQQLLKNLTVKIGNKSLAISTIAPGEFTVSLNEPLVGSYTINASGYAVHNGYNLSTSGFYPVFAQSQFNRLIVVPYDAPISALVNSSISDRFALDYSNGSRLTPAELATIVNASSVSLENSVVLHASISAGSFIYINFTLPDAGFYTLTWTSSITVGQTYSLLYSNSIQAQGRIAQGISLQLPKATAQQHTLFSYRVSVLYANGTTLDKRDTAIIFGVIYLDIYNGSTLIKQYAPDNYTAGQITFSLKSPPIGDYAIQVIVPSANISTGTVSAAQTSSLTSTRYALNSNSFVDGITSFFQAVGQNFVITMLVTFGLIALGYFFRAIYRLWRGDRKTAESINNTILSHAIEKMTLKYSNIKDVLPVYASLDYAEQVQFLEADRSVLRDLNTVVGKKNVSMEKIRDYVVKIKQHPESDGIFNIFRKQHEESGGMK
jgi:hypothetical protein